VKQSPALLLSLHEEENAEHLPASVAVVTYKPESCRQRA